MAAVNAKGAKDPDDFADVVRAVLEEYEFDQAFSGLTDDDWAKGLRVTANYTITFKDANTQPLNRTLQFEAYNQDEYYQGEKQMEEDVHNDIVSANGGEMDAADGLVDVDATLQSCHGTEHKVEFIHQADGDISPRSAACAKYEADHNAASDNNNNN